MTSDLQRFVDAQSQTYDQALAELRAGEKRTHWMWFVFPQIAGLGRSGMARHSGHSWSSQHTESPPSMGPSRSDMRRS